MGDPICKWRNASIETVVELVHEMPKKSMPNDVFRDYMSTNSIYGVGFNRTCYQLAAQLGLYHINEQNQYIPRFDHDISKIEAKNYLQKWISRYYVPNPYTPRRFDFTQTPVILLNAIIDFVLSHPQISNLQTICDFLFGEKTGNILCVKYILNNYTNLLSIDNQNTVSVFCGSVNNIYSSNKRDDKIAFYNTFN